MPDNDKPGKDWWKFLGAFGSVLALILGQWIYMIVQIHTNQQLSEENHQLLLRLQDKVEQKLDKSEFEARHTDLQHRVSNLEDLHKPK